MPPPAGLLARQRPARQSPGRFVREDAARNGCAVCIQIGVMDKGIHGAWAGRDHPPAGEAVDDAGSPVPAISRAKGAADYRVIVDLPDVLPVTEGELELLESELAEFIAELLKK
jgi:hypothetical protein